MSEELLNEEYVEQSTKAIPVQEDKKTVAKLWEKAVNLGIKVEQFKIKSSPNTLKIVSAVVPEIAPVAIPLAAFLKTKTGQKVIDLQTKNYDALKNVLTGNFSEAKEQIKENLSFITSDKGVETVEEIKDMAEGMKK